MRSIVLLYESGIAPLLRGRRIMRIVALEEHFILPDMVRRIDAAAITARGFPPPGAPSGPMSRLDELAELGEPRLRLMDEAGITTQVLSAAGPGADLLPQAVGPAFASELNDR